jgi:hypothetical protein
LHHCQNRHDHVAVMEEVKMLTWNTHTQKTVLVHCPESLNKCSDSHFFFKCLWQVLPKPWKKSASVDTSAVFSLL